MLKKIEIWFDKIADFIGIICAVLMVLMMLNVFYDVVVRYFFKVSNIGMQELEWHFFSLIILFGISHALKDEAHVRVDIFYNNFKPETQALINTIGSVIFILPISLLITFGSVNFVLESFSSGEGSNDPGGLAFRWIIKFMIPLSFALLSFMCLGYGVKNYNAYKSHKNPKKTNMGGL